MQVVPSIASSNLTRIADEIERIGVNFDNLHVDIEDGNFVNNITFGKKTIKGIKELTDKPFSIHLMVTNPYKYLEFLKTLKLSHVFVHVEGQMYLRQLIYDFKILDCKIGLALNPISNIVDYEYLLKEVDSLLFMTSEPDGQGENFNPEVLKKIKRYENIELWLDGGLNTTNIPLLEELSPDYIVMGREVFNSVDPKEFLYQVNRTM